MENKKEKIISILSEIASIIIVIVFVIFIFLSLGVGLIFLGSINIDEFKDDETLMREWKIKENKQNENKIENKSIRVSIWTPKIEVKNLKEEENEF